MTQPAPHSAQSVSTAYRTGALTGSVSTPVEGAGNAQTTSTNGSYPGQSVSTLPAMTEAHWQMLSEQSTAILRQVLLPIHLEGFSTSEIAKRLGIQPASVRLLADYVVTEMRSVAQPEPDEIPAALEP